MKISVMFIGRYWEAAPALRHFLIGFRVYLNNINFARLAWPDLAAAKTSRGNNEWRSPCTKGNEVARVRAGWSEAAMGNSIVEDPEGAGALTCCLRTAGTNHAFQAGN